MGRPRGNRAVQEQRGARLTALRKDLGYETQESFVPRLNEVARALGLPAIYRGYKVSRMEMGLLTLEDAAVWLTLTEGEKDWQWLMFGEEPPVSSRKAKPMRAPLKRASR